ncbi:MAG TPA: hypothetical protein VK447_14460 [Myxococcaceae bacterium]|nr:hypothetical protein [Myxococcaceae bacterium]
MAEKDPKKQVPVEGKTDVTPLGSGQAKGDPQDLPPDVDLHQDVRRTAAGAEDARRRTFGAGTSGAGPSEAGTLSDSSQGEFSGQVRGAPGPGGAGTYDSARRTMSISPEGERRTAAGKVKDE